MPNNIYETSTIAEMNTGIILANFEKDDIIRETSYQTEKELEELMIENLISQGYQRIKINNNEELYKNLREQIEKLNGIKFNENEWNRFVIEYLDSPNEGIKEKTRKIQENHIYEFTFDNKRIENIKIIDKKNIHNNILQVMNQFEQRGKHLNRYDVTILVNGLPLVQVELKRRGASLNEAFNQIHRYSKESFNTTFSLFKFIQIFVISNGTYTRYYANTSIDNYEFTCEWADARNKIIRDLEDFTKTFFEKRVLLEVLTKYCIFNVEDKLLIMRPYQIAATERILWKIKSSYENKKYGKIESGGFIWHTTGSGKTLTSFKTARLATELDFIDKVFFVVDRKDLDYQTMKEYQKFQKDSVNGSKNTKELKKIIEKNDNKIIVTTIQKLNEFVKKNIGHKVFEKQCVLIYDECHRSQFGDAQKNITKAFKKYYQFGFTGTPIFLENSLGGEITSNIFGIQLHSYVITDAIRDEKVLKFKVDYNNILPQFKNAEIEEDEKKLETMESSILLHPDRITEITRHILKIFDTKTSRNGHISIIERRKKGFNAMFAVQSVEAAKMYYNEFEKQQKDLDFDKRLRIATIFSYAPNEEQCSYVGDIIDENMEIKDMKISSKEFLDRVIVDYNKIFKTNYSTEGNDFQNYYKDISMRVKNKEIDLIIVVGMFLTGFDSPSLNTLFVDKNLRYHGLIQAYSRTNRILDITKPFGNIVCFRDLEKATKDAIKTFGDKNSLNVILEKSYEEYINGFKDKLTGKFVKGYDSICNDILTKFPNIDEVVTDSSKKEFIKLFGQLLKSENILRNYDEFLNHKKLINERSMQDYKSLYLKIRDSMYINPNKGNKQASIDLSDVEFHIELLRTSEINLDYILKLLLEKSKEINDIDKLKDEIRRVIRSSVSIMYKEELVINFLSNFNVSSYNTVDDILSSFYTFAKEKKLENINHVIKEERLKKNAKNFIEKSISKGYIDVTGTDLDSILPPTSRRNGAREIKKETVFNKIKKIVDIFLGI